jgi:uncharacterized membrane protein
LLNVRNFAAIAFVGVTAIAAGDGWSSSHAHAAGPDSSPSADYPSGADYTAACAAEVVPLIDAGLIPSLITAERIAITHAGSDIEVFAQGFV